MNKIYNSLPLCHIITLNPRKQRVHRSFIDSLRFKDKSLWKPIGNHSEKTALKLSFELLLTY